MIKKRTTMLILAVASVTAAMPVFAQSAPPQGDARAGAGKVAMCIGCHGIAGYRSSFPELYKVPKISGQGAAYMVAALTAYQRGERKHPTMRSIAESLTEQDMADIAAYYAEHGSTAVAGTPPAGPARVPGTQVQALLDKGACLSCHGEGFAKPIDPSYPKVAGQYADYLYAALKSYKIEGNPYIGRSNPVMGVIAKQFSNRELQTLARYLGALDSELQTVPQSSFRVAGE